MDALEIAKIENYLRWRFQMPTIQIKRRPQKDDSAEVFINEEFIGLIYRDDDDDDLSWSFQMAILEFDLDSAEP